MIAAESLLVALGAGAAAALLARGMGRAKSAAAFAIAATLAGSLGTFFPAGAAPSAFEGAPPLRKLRTYAGSEACRSCHPSEHASWARTYHRTMTTRPTSSNVLAPRDVSFELDGVRSTLRTDSGASHPARVVVESNGKTTPLMLATGSHHYQAYWTNGPRPGELALLPFVWLAADRRFAPRRAVFLTPETSPPNDLPWSTSCIQCHAVAGRPGRDEHGSRFESEVVELGIACEACHGPGARHVETMRNPLTRALARADGRADRAMVNPKGLSPDESVGVCAQCHSLSYPKDEATFWERGSFTERPERPWDTRMLLTYETLGKPGAPVVEASRESMFWRDGTIRIGGRETNAHALSPCFAKGAGERKATCLSCHSMHESDPDDQLARGKEGDGACTGCHPGYAREAHTKHAMTSSGSRCMGCHMPKTTFALLNAIRTHRIESPRTGYLEATGRLPACNLCHLDKDTMWTDGHLAQWSTSPAALPRAGAPSSRWSTSLARWSGQGVSAVRWLLAGDAAQRALAAAHFGMAEARAASGSDWQAPLLAELLMDPYPAVRYVAARSLRSIAGFEDLTYDFVGSPESRAAARKEARARFTGSIDDVAIQKLTSQRDDRAITIAE